jgi:hypothetical protein
MAGLQFINGLDNNQAKQQALQNWQNTYGQSRADLIPKYGFGINATECSEWGWKLLLLLLKQQG